MRFSTIVCVVCAFLLTACSPNSEPQVKRGEAVPEPTSTPSTTDTTSATPDAASSADVSPSKDSEADLKTADSGELNLNKLAFAVPEGWQRKQASSSFVLAEFVLPKAEGDDADGRLTVSVAGGSVEANVTRWRDQFGGKPEPAKQDTKKINGLDVTLVDFGGEFNDQRGPFAPGAKRPGYRMLAAIIPVDGELHFVKATGPQPTMAAHADRFQKFIESVKKK